MDATDTGEWLRVIARLSAERELLVDDFLERLGRTRLYDDYRIDDSDLRVSAREGVDMLLAQLAGDRLPDRLRDVPARLGVRRARQGVERDDLLEAVRLDFRVLWAGLIRAAGADSDAILVHHAEHVLSIVEQYINDVHTAYLDERASLASDSRLDEVRAMSTLFAAEAADVEQAATDVQDRLRFRPGQPLEVLCTSHAYAAALRRGLVEQRRHVIAWEFEDATAFVREDVGDGLPATVRDVPCGHVPGVQRLAGVPEAVELARRISRLLADGDGPTTEDACWPGLVRDVLSRTLPSVLPSGLAQLEDLADGERTRLIETVDAYWSTGSIKLTAERLYVHRNTIVNRLNAFAALTGLDPTIPAHAARAIVGLGLHVGDREPRDAAGD